MVLFIISNVHGKGLTNVLDMQYTFVQYTFDRQTDRQILYCLNNIFINKIYIDKKGTEIQCGMDFCAFLLYFTEYSSLRGGRTCD